MDMCSKHGEIELRMKALEEKTKSLEEEWNSRFIGYKEHFGKEIEKVKMDISESSEAYNSLNLTIVKLDNTVNNMVEKLNSFICEFESNAKDTKLGIIYPIIIAIVTGAIGAFIGHYIK